MRLIKSVRAMQKEIKRLKKSGKTIGFVPTMGFLHEGHASLLRQSRKDCDVSVLSIFVNPKQFAPNEDLNKYPRDLKKDISFAKKEGVDIMFHPTELEMYPDDFLTHVKVNSLGGILCGQFRPGHFEGVATVVTKLVNIAWPDILYLGQKDAQQAAVLKRMVEDLNFPVKVKVMPTIREKDGLAMSSRNSYLSPKQRQDAANLYKALQHGKSLIEDGERHPDNVIESIRKFISLMNPAKIDYIECRDALTFHPLTELQGTILIALAVWIGETRLIDNISVRVK